MCSSKTKQENDDMKRVSYASVIGNLMYVMVCTTPDIAHVVGVVNMYIKQSRQIVLIGNKVDLKIFKRHHKYSTLF